MSVTARTLVEAALRKIGIVDLDTPMEDAEAVECLDTFNRMVSGWALSGIDLGFNGPLSMGDTLPLERRYEEALICLLAAQLAPNYGVDIPFNPREYMRQIQAAHAPRPTQTIDTALLQLPSQMVSF